MEKSELKAKNILLKIKSMKRLVDIFEVYYGTLLISLNLHYKQDNRYIYTICKKLLYK
jgi:hypothetical protein